MKSFFTKPVRAVSKPENARNTKKAREEPQERQLRKKGAGAGVGGGGDERERHARIITEQSYSLPAFQQEMSFPEARATPVTVCMSFVSVCG